MAKTFPRRRALAVAISLVASASTSLTDASAVPVTRDPPAPRPVTSAVRLEARPDVAAWFGGTGALRVRAAHTMSGMAIESLGQLSPTVARRLGRAAWYRPVDVALYAVPPLVGDDGSSEGLSVSVIAVPRHAEVGPDGSVAPPPASSTAMIDPTFSSTWGNEGLFHWVAYNVDDGGYACPTTKGEVRGQWEYSRLRNVDPSSPHDYWGLAQRSVAVITQHARRCKNTIDSFITKMQSKTGGAVQVRQDPLTEPGGGCVSRTLTVGGRFGGINASIQQVVKKCERWIMSGALEYWASGWYGVKYDNNGVWGADQRESAALEIIRVPRGAGPGLNTSMGIDVDNRRA